MDNQEVFKVLNAIIVKLKSFNLKQEQVLFVISELEKAKKELSSVKQKEEEKDKNNYESMIKKGNYLLSEYLADTTLSKNGLAHCLNYLKDIKALVPNSSDQTLTVKKYHRLFWMCALLFIVLSPFFLGMIVPVLLLPVIYLGHKGIKNRTKTGFYFSISIAPLCFGTGVFWIINIFDMMYNNEAAFLNLTSFAGQDTHILYMALIIAASALGIILSLITPFLLLTGYKIHNLFS
ncbi:MAG: rane protein of unknown function [Oscillospiraceae bacterium]|nr:rane protein of unknown function [Oscillospiraceae bacterium]